MTSPNILTDTTPRPDGSRHDLVHSIITDAWGLYFAQGGVVMAAALRAMQLGLNRDDLALASASAVFCRPVACGPVETRVRVLRDGRRGAQVLGSLVDQTALAEAASDDAGSGSESGAVSDATSVAVSAVFTDPELPGPRVEPQPLPVELAKAPAEDGEPNHVENSYPLGFLDNTEWHVAAGVESSPISNSPLPRMALWFRFNDPPASAGASWDPALLPIPGDALGSALIPALGDGSSPVGSVSLQLDLQVLAPMTGSWIGIDTVCTNISGGLARGVVNLWSEAGVNVAMLTQTAMLRSF
ncbi:MAG: thioesterase family protein [Microthrixaceae bacterium]